MQPDYILGGVGKVAKVDVDGVNLCHIGHSVKVYARFEELACHESGFPAILGGVFRLPELLQSIVLSYVHAAYR